MERGLLMGRETGRWIDRQTNEWICRLVKNGWINRSIDDQIDR